jgi:hypothetical protein
MNTIPESKPAQTEQRKERRSTSIRQPKGKLQILQDDHCFKVTTVKDLSPRGIRLEIGTPLHIGENIRVWYLTGAVDIKLNGTVVWNSGAITAEEEQPASFIVGIELANPSLLQAFW